MRLMAKPIELSKADITRFWLNVDMRICKDIHI